MNDALSLALSHDAASVEAYLEGCYATYTDSDTAPVRDAELYSLTAGGKRIRPFLVMQFCRAFGGNADAALPFAAAVEMMHTFSLIHDDLPCMDNDDLRRGRLTSHKKFGEATALLAGDSLSLRALRTVLNNGYVSDATARSAASVLADAAGSEGMIGGQILDMRGEEEPLGFETLLKLHSKKTGALINASAILGCLAAGVPETDRRYAAAVDYSSAIGLTFQIIDDILDITSDAAVLGKNTGTDAVNNKTTFLSFMSVDDARRYAGRLTQTATDAISGYDADGLLTALARYLLIRDR